jgi:type I restriction enzyme, R subunit
MTPEQRARQQIDLLLQQCGWIVQNRSETNLAAGPGVAVREALLKTGEADYLLFAGGKAIFTGSTLLPPSRTSFLESLHQKAG